MRLFAIITLAALVGCQGAEMKPAKKPAPKPTPKTPVANVEVWAFTATWCGPCQRDKPLLAKLEAEGTKITYIDIDKEPARATLYSITSIPTYLVWKDGSVILRLNSADALVYYLPSVKKPSEPYRPKYQPPYINPPIPGFPSPNPNVPYDPSDGRSRFPRM